MNESIEAIKKLIGECSQEDLKSLKLHLAKIAPHPLEKMWGTDADTILSAISRSSDLTKRGVRGIIAEAVFVTDLVPAIRTLGWNSRDIDGDQSYDVLLERGGLTATVQVKLQRMENGEPKLYYPNHYEKGTLYVVEVQKTRSGKKITKKTIPDTETQIAETSTVTLETRPYKFGDFGILAVNMHPSSGDWKSFRYTLGSWLLPRQANSALIEIFQPVSALPNDIWTDDLNTCLEWFSSGEKRTISAGLLPSPPPRTKGRNKPGSSPQKAESVKRRRKPNSQT